MEKKVSRKVVRESSDIETLFKNKDWVSCFIDYSDMTINAWKDIQGLSSDLYEMYDNVELDGESYDLMELNEHDLNEYKDAGYDINVISGRPILESKSKKTSRRVVRESSDTIEAVKSALKSGKIDKKEAQRRMYAIADNDIRDADNNDAEMMDEADEVGTVEVERELDTADLPIQHADEDLVELPVFVVANPDLSDSEFFMVVDNDGDADDGVTIAKLTEDLQEVDHEATLELANELAARLGATAEVVNINALGVDAPDTVGDEGVLDEDGELLLDNDPEGDINEPVQGGFEVVANADGTVTFLGDVAELVSELAGDAAGEVMSELSEMPLVDDNLNSMIESAKSKLSAKQKRLAEASEE